MRYETERASGTTDDPATAQSEEAFVASFGKEADSDQAPDHDARPAERATPLKAASDPADDEDALDPRDPDAKKGKRDGKGDGKGDQRPAVRTPATADADEDEGEDDGEQDEDDEDADEDEDPAAAPDSAEAFLAELEQEGGAIDLESLPEAVRKPVERKLKAMEGGFTRVMQKVQADRRTVRELKAEQEFIRDNPTDFVLELLRKNPEIAERVNEELDAIESNPKVKGAHEITLRDKRQAALDKVLAAEAKAEGLVRAMRQIDRLGRHWADKLEVPYNMGIEQAIKLRIKEQGDITKDEIRDIARAQAKEWAKTARSRRRDESRDYTRQKVRDRAAGPRLTPRKGGGAGPPRARTATNDADFIEQMAARL
jgi:hypothetical protein